MVQQQQEQASPIPIPKQPNRKTAPLPTGRLPEATGRLVCVRLHTCQHPPAAAPSWSVLAANQSDGEEEEGGVVCGWEDVRTRTELTRTSAGQRCGGRLKGAQRMRAGDVLELDDAVAQSHQQLQTLLSGQGLGMWWWIKKATSNHTDRKTKNNQKECHTDTNKPKPSDREKRQPRADCAGARPRRHRRR